MVILVNMQMFNEIPIVVWRHPHKFAICPRHGKFSVTTNIEKTKSTLDLKHHIHKAPFSFYLSALRPFIVFWAGFLGSK